MDYFGLFIVKQGRKTQKRYGVLFTCLSCRAIHIEVAHSLSSDSFINAFRRFTSIRGRCVMLRMDRGTNFVGAHRELKESLDSLDVSKIESFLLRESCQFTDFRFNMPYASHSGGVWERQIRTVRRVLSSLLYSLGSHLDDESLLTLLCECSAIINSRPLSVEHLSDITMEPITPNHLLTMKADINIPPPGEFGSAECYSRKRWRRVQGLANQFWARWKKEYLQSLQIRSKWQRSQRSIAIGDIVLLKDDNAPRCEWSLCKVVHIYPSSDKKVRSIRLLVGSKSKSTTTYLDRSVHKCVLLIEAEST